MVARFDADGHRALFTELRVDGRAVASTCNFVSGPMGFAFKVGWDPEHRKLGPGMLNEVEFIRHARSHCADLISFDSGASADSFINRLWPERRDLGLLLMPSSRLASAALLATQRLRESRQARRTDLKIEAIITEVKA
jgi:Acetyltransferase (GNAT) domain